MASSHQHGGFQPGYNTTTSPSLYRAQYEQQQQQQQLASGHFTAAMRDRQARGKDPYCESDDSEDGGDWARQHRSGSKQESFAVSERRRLAAAILDCPELLMIHAQKDGDSIPATRLRYTRMLCGIDEAQPHPSSSRKKPLHLGGHRTSTASNLRRGSDRPSPRQYHV